MERNCHRSPQLDAESTTTNHGEEESVQSVSTPGVVSTIRRRNPTTPNLNNDIKDYAHHQEQKHHPLLKNAGDKETTIPRKRPSAASREDGDARKKKVTRRFHYFLLRLRRCRSRLAAARRWSTLALVGGIVLFVVITGYLAVFMQFNEDMREADLYELHLRKTTKCQAPAWEAYNFPNCNDLHEIDLPFVHERSTSSSESSMPRLGYLGKGYWRSVWAVDPRAGSMTEPVVVKLMRMAHDVTNSNFHRHRYDALVMERLTSSPHVVDIYGFCGNSVLTEFIGTPLDKVTESRNWDNPLARLHMTKMGRLRLALDVAKGLQALHEVPGGPVIHADIFPGQFLVTPAGQVKINDFNRCRIMGRYKKTGKPCDFDIDWASGRMRSPEEYALSLYQNEKIDVFSMGNVLYNILTGETPWEEYPRWTSNLVKRMIWLGFIPWIPFRYCRSDPELVRIISLAYTKNSAKRPSAA